MDRDSSPASRHDSTPPAGHNGPWPLTGLSYEERGRRAEMLLQATRQRNQHALDKTDWNKKWKRKDEAFAELIDRLTREAGSGVDEGGQLSLPGVESTETAPTTSADTVQRPPWWPRLPELRTLPLTLEELQAPDDARDLLDWLDEQDETPEELTDEVLAEALPDLGEAERREARLWLSVTGYVRLISRSKGEAFWQVRRTDGPVSCPDRDELENVAERLLEALPPAPAARPISALQEMFMLPRDWLDALVEQLVARGSLERVGDQSVAWRERLPVAEHLLLTAIKTAGGMLLWNDAQDAVQALDPEFELAIAGLHAAGLITLKGAELRVAGGERVVVTAESLDEGLVLARLNPQAVTSVSAVASALRLPPRLVAEVCARLLGEGKLVAGQPAAWQRDQAGPWYLLPAAEKPKKADKAPKKKGGKAASKKSGKAPAKGATKATLEERIKTALQGGAKTKAELFKLLPDPTMMVERAVYPMAKRGELVQGTRGRLTTFALPAPAAAPAPADQPAPKGLSPTRREVLKNAMAADIATWTSWHSGAAAARRVVQLLTQDEEELLDKLYGYQGDYKLAAELLEELVTEGKVQSAGPGQNNYTALGVSRAAEFGPDEPKQPRSRKGTKAPAAAKASPAPAPTAAPGGRRELSLEERVLRAVGDLVPGQALPVATLAGQWGVKEADLGPAVQALAVRGLVVAGCSRLTPNGPLTDIVGRPTETPWTPKASTATATASTKGEAPVADLEPEASATTTATADDAPVPVPGRSVPEAVADALEALGPCTLAAVADQLGWEVLGGDEHAKASYRQLQTALEQVGEVREGLWQRKRPLASATSRRPWRQNLDRVANYLAICEQTKAPAPSIAEISQRRDIDFGEARAWVALLVQAKLVTIDRARCCRLASPQLASVLVMQSHELVLDVVAEQLAGHLAEGVTVESLAIDLEVTGELARVLLEELAGAGRAHRDGNRWRPGPAEKAAE